MNLTDSASLIAILASSFSSATILPGSSEVLLVFMIREGKLPVELLIAVATFGNLCGGLTTYFLGRGIAKVKAPPKVLDFTRKYGSFSLLLSWVPVLGDAICLSAGWLRFNLKMCIVNMGIGKALRYAFVAWLIGELPSRLALVVQ